MQNFGVSLWLTAAVAAAAALSCLGDSATPATFVEGRNDARPTTELYAPDNRPVSAYRFRLPALDGAADSAPVALDGYLGRPTLVVFWADWCSYCRRELPELQKLSEACFGPNEIGLVGVVVEHAKPLPNARASAFSFAEAYGLTFDSGFDYTDRATKRYLPVVGTPSYAFIDAEGRLAGVSVGARGVELLRDAMGILAREQQPEAELAGC